MATIKDPAYSTTVKVVSVKGNDGGFGATAVLESIQPSVGIDVTLGGPVGPETVEIQVTEDAASIVKEGAELIVSVSPS